MLLYFFLLFQILLDGINPANPSAQDFSNAKMFMARKYDSTKDTLDEIRVTTLLSCDKPEDSPSTSNAVKYHLCRSFYQAARWINSSQNCHDDLPSPVSSGEFREKKGRLVPIMVTTEPMAAMLEEIVTCNCLGSCETGRCKSKKAGMKCTLLCHKKMKYNHDKGLNINTD